ncbi:hypothetical protein [Gilvimarinus sp. DA14]|uniref:hypothetical protein n=1 Tax=Gilvimarinus sp. DA14 TaxID=2956798 RepID=UPI0020B8B7FE|nr:hypothetical protein [Gilvimarinus sp. DA14]UTF61289.1 hypothetical protein NHM04_05675 [Gilvimarinus sp. DA14]
MKRFDFFVGGILGVIGLGISTLMFLTIYHWNSLYINIDNWKAAEILISSGITIAGWFIAMKMAINQLETSHKNNIKAQRETAAINDKLKAMNEMAEYLKEAALIAHNLSISVYSAKSSAEEESKNHHIITHLVSAQKHKDKLLDKWQEIFMQDSILKYHNVNINIEKFKNLIIDNFYGKICAWGNLQETGINYQSEKGGNQEKIIIMSSRMFDVSLEVFKECANLIPELSQRKSLIDEHGH